MNRRRPRNHGGEMVIQQQQQQQPPQMNHPPPPVWRIQKILQISDLNNLSRLIIHRDQVCDYILPFMTQEERDIVQGSNDENGLAVKIIDFDTGLEHDLKFKKWPSSKSYVLKSNWTAFAHSRNLVAGTRIGMNFHGNVNNRCFHFKVLSYPLQPPVVQQQQQQQLLLPPPPVVQQQLPVVQQQQLLPPPPPPAPVISQEQTPERKRRRHCNNEMSTIDCTLRLGLAPPNVTSVVGQERYHQPRLLLPPKKDSDSYKFTRLWTLGLSPPGDDTTATLSDNGNPPAVQQQQQHPPSPHVTPVFSFFDQEQPITAEEGRQNWNDEPSTIDCTLRLGLGLPNASTVDVERNRAPCLLLPPPSKDPDLYKYAGLLTLGLSTSLGHTINASHSDNAAAAVPSSSNGPEVLHESIPFRSELHRLPKRRRHRYQPQLLPLLA